ncbi:MAG: hypothetical protein KIT84_41455 [Labilithrix sp.]|nr:hypothetical protein [Labilithrix sp.]MCW5817539.1 hypothetical protein [Labilithrix sp.]
MKHLALALSVILAASGCKLLKRKAPSTGDAGIAIAALDASPEPASETARALDPKKDLPLGHWETEEGPKLCLTLLPHGRVRWASPVPHYRNPARVFGDVKRAEAISEDDFRVTIEVTKIYAKEIGPCHRYWTDYELFEAEILGERVTGPNENGHRLPELDGGTTAEPPRTYTLRFDEAREHVDVCTTAPAPACRKLVKRRSPSDFSRARTGAECKVDTDCVVVTNGEQCDPCLCPSVPSVRTWPKKKKEKPGDRDRDDSWEREPEHLCGAVPARHEGCAECPELRAVCKSKVCVLKK